MKTFVTGHAGYIGGVLAERLRDAGHEVVGFDRSENPEDDIRDKERVREAVENAAPDLVYHVAAEADVWEEEWSYLVENNVAGTVNVVEAARAVDAPVVFASSVAASGEFNRYGRSKRLAEQALSGYETVTTLRFPNVIGGNAPRGQARDMIDEGLDGEVEVWEKGRIRRSYVDVRDLADLLVEVGTGSFTLPGPTSVVSHTTTNREVGEKIATVVAEETGTRPDLSLVDRSPPSPRELTADGLRIREPRSLTESLRSQVRAAMDD